MKLSAREIEEFVRYVQDNMDSIPVREKQADGRFKNVMLSELSEGRFVWWVNKWIHEGVLPMRIKKQ